MVYLPFSLGASFAGSSAGPRDARAVAGPDAAAARSLRLPRSPVRPGSNKWAPIAGTGKDTRVALVCIEPIGVTELTDPSRFHRCFSSGNGSGPRKCGWFLKRTMGEEKIAFVHSTMFPPFVVPREKGQPQKGFPFPHLALLLVSLCVPCNQLALTVGTSSKMVVGTT